MATFTRTSALLSPPSPPFRCSEFEELRSPQKPHANAGTIGHADHGKDHATAAITKVDQARLPRASPNLNGSSLVDGSQFGTNGHFLLRVPSLVCFLNKVDAVEDEELSELVEMELRVMLVFYE
ncbi:hypothetical protein ZWY2020_010327 [Hordeum vulgare]|nr:hypothetical protein ZWY2020_010327 [Hordeum vulgare]